MAIAILPFKCPSCGQIEQGGSMVAWKKLGSVWLYACHECQERGMTEEQLLRVAIKAGWDAALEEDRRCQRQFTEPEIPDPSPFLRFDKERREYV